MGEEQARYIAQLEERISALEQVSSEHRHWRDPQWDSWTRMVNRYGRTVWHDHFRSGIAPVGYAWQGAPFGGAPGGAGGLLDWSFRGTYVRVRCDASPHFFSAAVVQYEDMEIVARCETAIGTEVGLRIDDGTDNNYAEFYLSPLGAPVGQLGIRVTFAFRAGGGAVTTDAGAIGYRSDIPVVLDLEYVNSIPAIIGYTVRESGRWDQRGSHSTGVIAWVPARAGLLFKLNGGFNGAVDWLYNEFD